MLENLSLLGLGLISSISEFLGWLALRGADIASVPEISLTLALLALITGVLSKSLSLFVGSILISVIAISALVVRVPEYAYLSIACQMLMTIGAVSYRRHVRRLIFTADKLQTEKENLQELLDREVIWRMAAHKSTEMKP